MAYITYEQYIGIYGSSPIQETEFPTYAELATNIIDTITQYRIVKGGLANLPPLTQSLVLEATAAQILYFSQLGLETVLTGQTGQSFTVGKVSVSGGGLANSSGTAAQLMVSPFAKSLLEQTGLMDRGVCVCSARYLNPFWGI